MVLKSGLRDLRYFNQIFEFDSMLPFIFGENGLLDHTWGGANFFTTIFALINSKQAYLFNKLGFKAVIAGPRGS